MDQVKTFLRQCIKYRFWIAVGLSVIFPMIGYFAFSGPIAEATVKRTGEIKSADTDVQKYTAPNQPVPDVTRVVAEKREVLAKDVDATQRKLYELQEPLLRWPEVVEDKFRTWGRKYPPNVDPSVVQTTIGDYYIAYPAFVDKVYKTFKPWNPEDGKGIVYAPDKQVLLKPAPFTLTSEPDLGKVWAEQERLWVVTALLDVVAKVNDAAGAKDWDTAWIREIVDINVGSLAAQDQQSMAKGVALAVAEPLLPEGAPPPEAAPAADGRPGGMGAMGGPGASNAGEVYFLKSDSPLPYKVLPVQMTVRLDQNRLSEFLVALENSPMAIQVMEPEISKPTAAVVRPVYGETTGFGAGGMMSGGGGRGMAMPFGGGDEGMRMGGGGMNQAMRGGRGGNGMPSERPGSGGGGGGGGGGGASPQGTNLRGVDRTKQRKDKEAAAKKSAPKKTVDQFYNIVEVTIYGQARFYNTPAPIPPVDASASAGAAPAATDAAAAPPVAAPATPPARATAPAPATPPAAPAGRDR